MSVKDQVVAILNSRGRVDKPEAERDVADHLLNLTAAVRELQDAVVYLGGEIDRREG